MEPITLTVNLDLDRHLAGEAIIDNDGEHVGNGPTTLEDVVLNMVADKLLAKAVRDENSGFKNLRDRVAVQRTELIREALEPTIAEALEAPISRTNSYGEPVGKTTTLRELIVAEATKQLTPKDGDRYGHGKSALTKFIEDEVNRQLTGELKKTLDEAKAQVLARVQEAGGEVIAETLKRATTRF